VLRSAVGAACYNRRMRRLAVSSVALALLLTLTACNSGKEESDDEQAVRAVAEEVAAALPAGSLAEVDWAEGPPEQAAEEYAAIVDGMGAVEPTVDVTRVSVEDGEATAVLGWSWPVGRDESWEYAADLTLTGAGDDWAPRWAPSVVEPDLAEGEVLTAATVGAERGDITGRGGAVLVTERPVLRYGIDRTRVDAAAAPASARALARAVDIDVAPYVRAVKAAGDRAFVEAITYRRGQVPPAVRAAAGGIDGVLIVSDTMALAPTSEFAAPILGRVGPVTAEMVEDRPEDYRVGDVAGLSGLQARYDDQLRGRVGVVVNANDPEADRPARELHRVDASAGQDLALTLDPRLQRAAEGLLAAEPSGAAVVALRPSDGAILAAANGSGTGGLNHATYGQFAPGSTFKIVSSLALLRSGVTPETTVQCTPTVDVDGRDFENYDDYPSSALGPIPFRTAIAQSCNTAVIGERGRLEEQTLADAAASLGLGVDHDLGFPAYFGSVPPAASETEEAADLIGQGKVLASPMAMAAVIASVQQGDVVVPRLVRQVEVSPPDGVTPVSPAEARQLRSMLRQAVTDGSASGLADVPGPPVIAKTGTAEFEGDEGLQTHGWMVAAQGDLAVAVFVELGESGSQAAGPIIEGFLRAAG
jgi:cell division protein FtsI/penicillin-binding protein 2